MRMPPRSALAAALATALALAVVGGARAQDAAPSGPASAAPGGAAAASAAPGGAATAPLQLDAAGAADGENALSRFGIVTLGSFPIMLLYADFSVDLGRYFLNGFNSAYAPWPFKSEYAEPPSQAEKAARIGVAIGASVAVGAIDYLIRLSKAKKARLQREALLELSEEERKAGPSGAAKASGTGQAP
jgi:hypothetical protein